MENVLAKKLSGAKSGRSPIADTELLADRFVRRLEVRLQPVLGTSVGGMVLDLEITRMSSVSEGVPVPALLGVFDFKGAECSTLVNMNSDLAFHTVDLCMGGDPAVCPTPETRTFTKIDYTLCEEVLQAASEAFFEALCDVLGGSVEGQFELIDVQQNITNVSIAPDTADVLAFNATLDIGDAARGGDISIVVPLSVLDVVRASVSKAPKTAALSNDIWRSRMKRAASEATIPLRAVLHRTSYKTTFLESLEVGQVIEIPRAAPQNISLVMTAPNGEETGVANARLGAYEEHKVVKLTTPLHPSLIEHLKSLIDD